MQLAIFGLDNPTDWGVRTLSVSTSSNSARSASYRIVTGSSVGAVALLFPTRLRDARCYLWGDVALPASGTLVAGLRCHRFAVPQGLLLVGAACSSGGSTVTDLTTKATGDCEFSARYLPKAAGNL